MQTNLAGSAAEAARHFGKIGEAEREGPVARIDRSEKLGETEIAEGSGVASAASRGGVGLRKNIVVVQRESFRSDGYLEAVGEVCQSYRVRQYPARAAVGALWYLHLKSLALGPHDQQGQRRALCLRITAGGNDLSVACPTHSHVRYRCRRSAANR